MIETRCFRPKGLQNHNHWIALPQLRLFVRNGASIFITKTNEMKGFCLKTKHWVPSISKYNERNKETGLVPTQKNSNAALVFGVLSRHDERCFE